MRLLQSRESLVAGILLGAIVGFIGGPALVLLVWALLGLGLGAVTPRRKWAAISGAVYGFALSYIFMIHVYNGQAPLSTRLIPFLAFGAIGALCGSILGLVGNACMKLAHKPSKTQSP